MPLKKRSRDIEQQKPVTIQLATFSPGQNYRQIKSPIAEESSENYYKDTGINNFKLVTGDKLKEMRSS
jgi:hypothetical protein